MTFFAIHQDRLVLLIHSSAFHLASLSKYGSPPFLTYLQSVELLNVSRYILLFLFIIYVIFRQIYQCLNVLSNQESAISELEKFDVTCSIQVSLSTFIDKDLT